MQFRAQLVKGGCKRRAKCCFQERQFHKYKMYMYFNKNFILSVKLLKTTTDGAVSKMSNEIHLKLDNCQLDTSCLLATWPEFWAIGLSFLGFYFLFCIFNGQPVSP